MRVRRLMLKKQTSEMGDEFCDLTIDCWDESIENLPIVKELDQLVGAINKNARIKKA